MSSVKAGLWCLLFSLLVLVCFSFLPIIMLCICFALVHHASLFLCHCCFHPGMNVWCYSFSKIAKSCCILSAISWVAPSSTSCKRSLSSLSMVTSKPLEEIQRGCFKIISKPSLPGGQLLLAGGVKSQYVLRKKYRCICQRCKLFFPCIDFIKLIPKCIIL